MSIIGYHPSVKNGPHKKGDFVPVATCHRKCEYMIKPGCDDTVCTIVNRTDVSIVICGTYELKDLIAGERKSNKKQNHNRSQLFRRLRLAEFTMIDESEIYDYLAQLEQKYTVIFDSKVKSELVSQCRDRPNGGLGNFIEIIELLFSQVRPEWKTISHQLIRENGRVLHTHTEHIQSFTGIKPRKKKDVDDEEASSDSIRISTNDVPLKEEHTDIDVASLPIVHINTVLYHDSLRHKMLK